MNKKTVRDIDVNGKKVLVRCDFNVPLDADMNITDETRINAALPTIRYLLDHNAAVILCSHLGRPKGEFNMKYSLARWPGAERQAGLCRQTGQGRRRPGRQGAGRGRKARRGGAAGERALHARRGEERPRALKELASLADIYVSDAFGTVHRAHASTAGVAAYLPAVAGFLIGKELDFWAARSPIRRAPSWRFSAAPRSRTRSASSRTSWTRWIRF